MTGGRPFRFLAVTLGGWTALRVVMLWPGAVPAGIAGSSRAVANILADLASPAEASTLAPAHPDRPAASPAAVSAGAPAAPRGRPVDRQSLPLSRAVEAPVRVATVAVATAADAPQIGVIPPPLRPTPAATGESRLSGSAWLLARGGANGTLLGGQLGGSQAGLRVNYALGHARRVALAARIATPLHGAGRELGLGVEWRPTRLPVRLIAEQRIGLDGQKGGPTLMVAGGVGPVDIAGGSRLEAYAQAGAIARDGVEAFGDGAARLTWPLAKLGAARLDLGAGVWGAGQRGAARLDLGPTLGVVVPIGERALRVTLDWRQRVAGDARPGSGPALSIGSDF